MKKAIVLGASGAVGLALVGLLVENKGYSSVELLVRRPLAIEHPKVKQHLFDYDAENYPESVFDSQDVYCCVGTTMHKAGSKSNFRAVDYHIPLKAARASIGEGRFLLISSIGAHAHSRNFYLRTKGELERDLQTLLGNKLKVARPSLLLGKRLEKRRGEDFAIWFYRNFGWLFRGILRKYKAIAVGDVARALIWMANEPTLGTIFESNELEKMSEKYQNKSLTIV